MPFTPSTLKNELISQVNNLLEQFDEKVISHNLTSLKQEQDRLEKQIIRLGSKKNEANQKLVALRNSLTEKLKKLAELKKENESLQTSIANEAEKLTELTTLMQSNKSEDTIVNRGIASKHERAIQENKENAKQLKATIEEISAQKNALQSQQIPAGKTLFDQQSQELSQIEEEKNLLDKKVDAQKIMNEEARKNLKFYDELSEKLHEIKTAFENFQPQNEDDEGALNRIKDRLFALHKLTNKSTDIGEITVTANKILFALATRALVNTVENADENFNSDIAAWDKTKENNGVSPFLIYINKKIKEDASLEKITQEINNILTTESGTKNLVLDCVSKVHLYSPKRENGRTAVKNLANKTAEASSPWSALSPTLANFTATVTNFAISQSREKTSPTNSPKKTTPTNNINIVSAQSTIVNTTSDNHVSSVERKHETVEEAKTPASAVSTAPDNHLLSVEHRHEIVEEAKTVAPISREEMKAIFEMHVVCSEILESIASSQTLEAQRVESKKIELSKKISSLRVNRENLLKELNDAESKIKNMYQKRDPSIPLNFDETNLSLSKGPINTKIDQNEIETETAEKQLEALPTGLEALKEIPATLAPDLANRPNDSADVLKRKGHFDAIALKPTLFRELATAYKQLTIALENYKKHTTSAFGLINLAKLLARLEAAISIKSSINNITKITNKALAKKPEPVSPPNTDEEETLSTSSSFSSAPSNQPRNNHLLSFYNVDTEQKSNDTIINISDSSEDDTQPPKPKTFWQRHKWKILFGIGFVVGGAAAAIVSIALQVDLLTPYISWLTNVLTPIGAGTAITVAGGVAGGAVVLTGGAAISTCLTSSCCNKKTARTTQSASSDYAPGGSTRIINDVQASTGSFVAINVDITESTSIQLTEKKSDKPKSNKLSKSIFNSSNPEENKKLLDSNTKGPGFSYSSGSDND